MEGKRSEAPKRAIHHLLRFIRLRAALAWPQSVVVIAPKQQIELFDTLGLPENVEVGDFGAIAGIDRWRTAAGLICIGRLQPGPPVVEAMVGVVTGRVPQTVLPGAHMAAPGTRRSRAACVSSRARASASRSSGTPTRLLRRFGPRSRKAG